jgi:2-polyprenyl-6-methoxyphenol hydroxylase-like FAD-dependent oxidoreductase
VDARRNARRRAGEVALRAAIVGAGPAGAALAYLLARRGVEVALVERQSDFAREFRGEGLMPGGVDALHQMGLRDELEALPQSQVSDLSVFIGHRRVIHLDASVLPVGNALPRFVSQPALLEMLVAKCSVFPGFELLRGATARDLVHEGGRVAGVRVDTPGGPRELRADFVFGCDGRASLVRKRAGLEIARDPQNFDVVWLKLPLPDFMRGAARACIGRGHFSICFPSPDGGLQIGWIIEKGSFGELRKRGVDGMLVELEANVPPDLAAWVRGHRLDVEQPFLLDVVCDQLERWSAPGVLLFGDAAHPMSPVGAQGINIALRDALVVANQLGPPLAAGATPAELDAAALRVTELRMPEVRAIQAMQKRPPAVLFQRTLASRVLLGWVVPFLARTGIARPIFTRVVSRFAFGIVDVKLEF